MQNSRTSKAATWYVYGSMTFWTLLVILAFWWLGAIALLVLRGSRGRFFRRVILLYGRLMIYVAAFPVVRVSYENRGADRGKPGLYIFNHRSASDPFLVAALGLPAIQIVNGWPMRLPFFGFFANLGDYIDSTTHTPEALFSHIRRVVDEGAPVMVFPEGTRSGSRRMNPFHSGAFRAAKELDLKIYPCCIVGNENLPTRQFKFATGRVRVIKGEALEESLVREKSPYVLKKLVQEQIAGMIASVEGEDEV